MRMLGGGASGTDFEDFFGLPSATRTKLPMPTTKASGKSADWRSFDQSLLVRIVWVFRFILDPDIRLEIDQARIILRFNRFPNGAF
jgi:hypothetical protein